MRADDNESEIQELIAHTRKTLLKGLDCQSGKLLEIGASIQSIKVIKHKLKQLYIQEQKKFPGQVLRDVHLEILKRNLTLL